MSPDRVRLFDQNTRKELCQIRAAVRRNWVLNGVGEAEISISMLDGKYKEENFRPGTLVYVQNGRLPDWVGVIDLPQDWSDGHIFTTAAYSAECLFGWRIGVPTMKLKGTAGAIYKKIIAFANQKYTLGLSPGNIYTGGSSREETMQDTRYLLDNVKRVASRAGNDWDVTAQVVGGKLLLSANWYKRAGLKRLIELRQGHNIEGGGRPLRYEGRIVNWLTGVGEGENEDNRPQVTLQDEESAALYGWRQDRESFSGVKEPATLRANTSASLQRKKQPSKIFKISALDVGDLWDQLQPGDIYPVSFPLSGWTDGEQGTRTQGRIMGMSYRPDGRTVDLQCEELIPGLE